MIIDKYPELKKHIDKIVENNDHLDEPEFITIIVVRHKPDIELEKDIERLKKNLFEFGHLRNVAESKYFGIRIYYAEQIHDKKTDYQFTIHKSTFIEGWNIEY